MRSGHSLHGFLYYAKKGIRENPEVFDALLEFERTKRVPKLSYRRRIDITLDESVLRRLRSVSADKGIPLSRFIERALLRALREDGE